MDLDHMIRTRVEPQLRQANKSVYGQEMKLKKAKISTRDSEWSRKSIEHHKGPTRTASVSSGLAGSATIECNKRSASCEVKLAEGQILNNLQDLSTVVLISCPPDLRQKLGTHFKVDLAKAESGLIEGQSVVVSKTEDFPYGGAAAGDIKQMMTIYEGTFTTIATAEGKAIVSGMDPRFEPIEWTVSGIVTFTYVEDLDIQIAS